MCLINWIISSTPVPKDTQTTLLILQVTQTYANNVPYEDFAYLSESK